MAAVSEVLKNTFDSARAQLTGLEKRVQVLEKQARKSIAGVRARADEVPDQLKGAWSKIAGSVRGGLIFATRDELRALAARVEELAEKIDQLSRTRAQRKTVS